MRAVWFSFTLLLLLLSSTLAFADGPNNFTSITPFPINTPKYAGQQAVDGAGRQWIVADTPIPVSAGVLAEATAAPMITILPTALPTAYSTPQFAAVAAGLKSFFVDNSTNQDIWCSNGTASQFIVHPGSTWWDNLGAKELKSTAPIGCIHPGSTPASGTVVIGGEN